MAFEEVRVRFAPSPTGYLHVGGARTALYNYLYAKKHNGKFILRIEDTDQERSTEESLKMVLEDLQWLGLKWDEGPNPESLEDMGPHGPYKQSQRLGIYKKIAEELIQSGNAYYCFMTDEEIEMQREELKAKGLSLHVKSPYEDWPLAQALAEMKSGKSAVVRFKTSMMKKDFQFKDLIRGDITFPSDMVGDFVLLRSDGMPVYNFCCVVDDHMMKISHVLRAEEHLPNTLRQMMIYDSMKWTRPEFGHLSLILDEDRQKLSKRKGATSCHEFKNEGYMPEALLNFIALMGWSHANGKEVLTMDEMISGFDLTRANPAGAIFDAVKLKWMNSQHLRELSHDEIWKGISPWLLKEGLELPSDKDWQDKSIGVFKSYMETWMDAVNLYRPISDKHFTIKPEADEFFAIESTKSVLSAWKELVAAETADFMTEERFLKIQDQVKEKTSVKGKNLFMPIRIAVIGQPHGAELKILVPLMKKSSLLARVDQALAKVQ
jgi:nondiscriminating glutamyl-tRNA synthetase